MEALIQAVARAKAMIDNGFSRVGPSLKKAEPAEKALIGGACRVVALSDAVVVLCRNNHSQEAVLLLRPLAATALAMRWLAQGSSSGLDRNFWDLDWGRVWDDPAWGLRLRQAGVPAEERKSIGAVLSAGGYRHMCVTPLGVPWAHVISERSDKSPSAEEVLKTAVRAMAHAVRALDARWPGSFGGAEELC